MSSATKQEFYLLKKVNQAVRDHDMIQDGDRIAVAVSGGKDSLGLLRLLRARQSSAPEQFQLVALHVRRDEQQRTPVILGALEAHLRQEGVEHHFLDMELADDEPLPLSCFRCSWHRRKALFQAAHNLGCSKLAFGHHADDVAHTTLLNLFYHGRLETMHARVSFFDGTIILIRPLVYVPEKELVRFARACGFPAAPGCCEQGANSARQKMRELLRSVERDIPRAKRNLRSAVRQTAALRRPPPPAEEDGALVLDT